LHSGERTFSLIPIMSTVNRENFDRFWLRQKGSRRRKGFQAISLEEAEGSRTKIEGALLAALYDHHIHPHRVSGALRRLGYEKAAAVLLQHFPRADRTRKGNFGEVVASEHLRQRHGLQMPVFKLRYADNPQMPQRGEDIVAFEVDDEARIVTLCIGEAKVRITNSSAAIREAHDRLSDAYHPYPVALSLISSVLHESGNHELGDQVDELMETMAQKRLPRQNWIFVITESQPSDTFKVLTEETGLVEDLMCVHIRLDDLGELVTSLFESSIPRDRHAD
jgi:hypothetical protein